MNKYHDLVEKLAASPAVKKLTRDLDRRGIGYEIIPIHHLEGGVFGDFHLNVDTKKDEEK